MRQRLVLGALVTVVGGLVGCGGGDEAATTGQPGTGKTLTEVRPSTSCTDWPRATDEARQRVADELKRGSQTASERLQQIDAACRRYGPVSIDQALEMLAVDEHRPTG